MAEEGDSSASQFHLSDNQFQPGYFAIKEVPSTITLSKAHGRVYEQFNSPPVSDILISDWIDVCSSVDRKSCIPPITRCNLLTYVAGHPCYTVDEKQIEAMMELSCSYEQMAVIPGISST